MAHAYRGALGRTRTTTVHVTDHSGALVSAQLHTSVDAASDPELGERLLAGSLNVVELDGAALRLAVPVIYHDPYAELLVLVLPDAYRHRELDERIAVLQQLRDDAAPIPPYAKDFAVVFGGAGLGAYLAQRRGSRATDPALDSESFDAVTYIEPEAAAESEIEAETYLRPATGVAPRAGRGPDLRARPGDAAIASDTAAQGSGSIGTTPARPQPQPGSWSNAELLALLEDNGRPESRLPRVVAALALCHRADPRHADAVIAAAMTMSRNEAVRVLAMAVKFGGAGKPALLEGLSNTKAYLRHGCALALALLRTEDATQAVIDLLLSESTELWREIARAIGHIGAAALAPLADRYQHPGQHAATAEARIVWAMAHIGVRGGKQAISAMAEQPSIVAPIAAKALTMLALAASDQVDTRRGATPPRSDRDATVNQAFSRQFFEALEQDRADASEMRHTSTVVEP